jgi:hypothetical protein
MPACRSEPAWLPDARYTVAGYGAQSPLRSSHQGLLVYNPTDDSELSESDHAFGPINPASRA